MFYHFKGTVTAEDYVVPMLRSNGLMTGILSVVVLALSLVMGLLQGHLLSNLIFAVVLIVIYYFGSPWLLKRSIKRRVQPQAMDQYVTREQLVAQLQVKRVQVTPEAVYLFSAHRQFMIFKKSMMADVTQWESFVAMARGLAEKKK